MRMRGCVKWIVVAVSSLAALALLGLCAFAVLYLGQQEQADTALAGPTVLVTEPATGALVPAGSTVLVSATASGFEPIIRVELWMDGELKETEVSDQAEGLLPFYAHFSPAISEGPHFLSVRAVDTAGLVGQSLQVGVTGAQEIGPSPVFLAVTVEEGETLADIATAYDTEPETLQDLNPELGGQEPAPGTIVKVPAPPQQVPSPGPPPSPGPQLPPAPGGVTVTIPDLPMLTGVRVYPVLEVVAALYPFEGSPPNGPTDLQGQVDGCDVTLTWHDNATDETRYEVWTALGMLAPRVVASLEPSTGTGPAWVKFFAPESGWVPFWVDAVNSEGSQPSNEITLFIESKCSTPASDYLQVEVFDMTLQGNYDKVYCYAAYEGTPEQRIPETAGDFIQASGGKADFSAAAAGPQSKIIPKPADGTLDLLGKCYGWSGTTLTDLGSFSGQYGINEWDGTRRSMQGGSYQIEFAIRPWSQAAAAIAHHAMYGYEDPTLPIPFDLTLKHYWSPPRDDALERILSWNWTGQEPITGFMVFLDGVPYKVYDGASLRQAVVFNPGYCGRHVKWQVAAVAGPMHSPLSPAVEYDLTQCRVWAEVEFLTLTITCAATGVLDKCPDCGRFDVIDMGLVANNKIYAEFTETFRWELDCGTWPVRESLTVPIGHIWGIKPSEPVSLRVGSRFQYMNPFGEPANFQWRYRTITMPLEEWETYEETFELEDGRSDVWSSLRVRVTGFAGYYQY
jgi:hypothetical protein